MNRRHFLTHAAGAVAAGGMFSPLAVGAAVAPGAAAPVSSTKYVPKPKPVVKIKPGEFVFAAAHLDHSHINGMCTSVIEAGGTLKWVFEPDAAARADFQKKFPQAKVARSLDEILADPEVKMVAAAAVPNVRGPIGCRVMDAGKDYFTDKTPFTTLAQLDQAKAVVARTGRRYFVYFSERLSSETAMFATDLINDGVIGKVVSVVGLGPHRLGLHTRPAWFFEKEKYGGILCDIGSHQCEAFLAYANATDASVVHAAVGNFANPQTPELEDFGEATFVANTGASNQIRVDWYTPDGLSTWGDGRTFILGTKGYLEMRKYVDVARAKTANHLYLVDGEKEHYFDCNGRVGYRFFNQLIDDSLHRTETAMTQAHIFKAAELCLKAQLAAKKLT
jgi:predicted dehydrogenase